MIKNFKKLQKLAKCSPISETVRERAKQKKFRKLHCQFVSDNNSIFFNLFPIFKKFQNFQKFEKDSRNQNLRYFQKILKKLNLHLSQNNG